MRTKARKWFIVFLLPLYSIIIIVAVVGGGCYYLYTVSVRVGRALFAFRASATSGQARRLAAKGDCRLFSCPIAFVSSPAWARSSACTRTPRGWRPLSWTARADLELGPAL